MVSQPYSNTVSPYIQEYLGSKRSLERLKTNDTKSGDGEGGVWIREELEDDEYDQNMLFETLKELIKITKIV